MSNIEIGDKVHARFYSPERDKVAVQSFVVTDIQGTIYYGGALDCDTSTGWEVTLSVKAVNNLNLPSGLSEITVLDFINKKTHLTGKELTWRDNNGVIFPVDKILSWEEGHV
jgi:hypothetical protein